MLVYAKLLEMLNDLNDGSFGPPQSEGEEARLSASPGCCMRVVL